MSEAVGTSITVTLADAEEFVLDIFKAGLVPMLVSSPGIGKSSLAKQIAKKYNLKLIDIRLSQCDPVDLNGFPFMDPVTGKASYRPMDLFPLESDPLPINPETGKPYAGWLILLDEINAAPKAVEVASYKILLDRMVGMFKLHPKALIMGAGNLKTDKAVVNSSGTAQQSRMVWLEIRACIKAWMMWADQHDVDHRVKSYLQFKPDMLHKFDPNHTDKTFPCPRTWEFCSKLIHSWKELTSKKLPVIAGAVGAGPSREFYSYTQIFQEIPTLEQILADPVNVRFGNEPSMHYALAGLVSSHLSDETADALTKFLDRLPADFQVSAFRSANARDRSIRKTKAFKDWYAKNSWELVY